jgi:protein PhnA
MSERPSCPQCKSNYAYEDHRLYVCPECGHEWPQVEEQGIADARLQVRDANGNVLVDGDTVTMTSTVKSTVLVR